MISKVSRTFIVLVITILFLATLASYIVYQQFSSPDLDFTIHQVLSPDDCLTLESINASELKFRVVEEDIKIIQRETILQNEVDGQAWQQQLAYMETENTFGSVFLFSVNNSNKPSGLPDKLNPILLHDGEFTAYLMIRNEWATPHYYRVIFLIDFQPVKVVNLAGMDKYYYDFPSNIMPGEDDAFAFTLPDLSSGFHQLSILLILDPENPNSDPEYRLAQKLAFEEHRYDLWIQTQQRPKNVPAFTSVEQGQAADTIFQAVELIVDSDDSDNTPLEELRLSPGAETCIYLRFFNKANDFSETYKGPRPVQIITFWDDEAHQVFRYDLADAPDNLTLPLKIQAPESAGSYQFNVAIFTFPGYSQFGTDGLRRTGFTTDSFSRRVAVTVQP